MREHKLYLADMLASMESIERLLSEQ